MVEKKKKRDKESLLVRCILHGTCTPSNLVCMTSPDNFVKYMNHTLNELCMDVVLNDLAYRLFNIGWDGSSR